jgi:hypothetical protein
MIPLPLLRLMLISSLLYTSLGRVSAQTYASVADVPLSQWDYIVEDRDHNPVTGLLAPNTYYFLRITLNTGITVTDLHAYVVFDGDGWYRNGAPPQSFPDGVDTSDYYAGYRAYYGFKTVGADDFSGAYFKIRLSNGYTLGPVSSAKSKLFQ